MCDRCNKPVDLIEEWQPFEGLVKAFFRIRVYCHGESETVDLETEILESGIRLEFGRAFVGPKRLQVP
jgi:hypothetical protein